MEEGRKNPPINVLPPGEEAIPLPSETWEVKFHISNKTEVLLLDDTTAKRREVLAQFENGDPGSPRAHVLPRDKKIIILPSEQCEEKFHVTSSVPVPLLHD